MSRYTPPTFNKKLTNAEVEVFCYFCKARRVYWKTTLPGFKKPYRCKKCAAKIRAGHIKDVIHEDPT